MNSSKRLGLALLGAVLAAGLLAAAGSTPADAGSPSRFETPVVRP
ncbi:hypothetical protein WDV06_04225 [Streptomyces racemochromogenes]|uniref:Uncharacterized protein n=1 Tax=Streptomyces racemochromogenes TaxID=67353 RepID=A0ABW7P8B7_9ACTN